MRLSHSSVRCRWWACDFSAEDRTRAERDERIPLAVIVVVIAENPVSPGPTPAISGKQFPETVRIHAGTDNPIGHDWERLVVWDPITTREFEKLNPHMNAPRCLSISNMEAGSGSLIDEDTMKKGCEDIAWAGVRRVLLGIECGCIFQNKNRSSKLKRRS